MIITAGSSEFGSTEFTFVFGVITWDEHFKIVETVVRDDIIKFYMPVSAIKFEV